MNRGGQRGGPSEHRSRDLGQGLIGRKREMRMLGEIRKRLGDGQAELIKVEASALPSGGLFDQVA